MLPWEIALLVAVALATSLALWWIRRHEPLGADEAYLWYGTREVIAGRQPLRDIRSYEPGRYWWCSLALRLFGDRLATLRLATHLVHALGILVAGLTLLLGGNGWWAVAAIVAVLNLWAASQHKTFEPATELTAVLAGTAMLVAPGLQSGAFSGAVVGLSLAVGANVALYVAVGLAIVTLLVPSPDRIDVLFGALGGGLVGLLPMAWWLCSKPDTARALLQRRVIVPLRRRSTNLPLPVPWPWRAPPPRFRAYPFPGRAVMQVLFVALPVLSLGVLAWSLIEGPAWRTTHAAAVAAAAVGLPTLHHAYSRADAAHLAQAISPSLVAAVALVSQHGVVMLVGSLIFVGASAAAAHARGTRWRGTDLQPAADDVPLTERHRQIINTLAPILARLAPREPLVAIPTLLPILVLSGRRSGVTDTFCVYPADSSEEEDMIQELTASRVRLVVVDTSPLDGREELAFPMTHPKTWRHLHAAFQPYSLVGLPPRVAVFVAASLAPAVGSSGDRSRGHGSDELERRNGP